MNVHKHTTSIAGRINIRGYDNVATVHVSKFQMRYISVIMPICGLYSTTRLCLLYIDMEVGSNIPFPDNVRFSAGSQQCCVYVNDIMKMHFNLLHGLHKICKIVHHKSSNYSAALM